MVAGDAAGSVVGRPQWWPRELCAAPPEAVMPRVETEHHPSAVGTYGPALVEWVEREMGVRLRWWQRFAAARLLEHDESGALVWSEACVSTSRQNGKSILLRALAAWRIHQAGLIGETQTVLHVSNSLGVVNEVAAPALVWAKERGYHVRRTNGEVEIRLPDQSRWVPRSSRSAYGLSVGMALVDECWDLEPLVVDSMITPTLLERRWPQLVLFSTAHPRCTSLVPSFRSAGSVEDQRLVLEWSAPADADRADPAVWRLASPHWSDQRAVMLARQVQRVAPDDFAAQYLNTWPVIARDTQPAPFQGWSLLPAVSSPEPPRGALVALDEHYDASGCMVAAYWEGQLWVRQVPDLRSAVELARSWTDGEVLVGFSLRHAAAALGLAHIVAVGARETALGVPLLLDAVRRRALAHDHSEAMAAQAEGARTSTSETGGITLSVRHSRTYVTGLKLAGWLLLRTRDMARESARIW